MTNETKFESTVPRTGAGNGKLLIVRAGNLITGGDSDEKTPLATGEDNALHGRYEGSVPNKFEPTRSDYKIRQDDGTLIIFSSTANIKRGFANVTIGELVRVVYNGKREMKTGKNAGKFVQDFDVQRAVTATG